MLIKFKNKMTMAIKKMLDEGYRLGGMPSHIEVSPSEALELFMELHTLKPIPQGFVITATDGTSCKLLFNNKNLTQMDLMGYVTHWKEKQWKVEYNKIEIVIVNPPPQQTHLHS